MPSRRRTTSTSTNRRPRVAGLPSTVARPDDLASGATTVTDTRPARHLDDERAPARLTMARAAAPTDETVEAVPEDATVEVPPAPEDRTVEVTPAEEIVEDQAPGEPAPVDITKKVPRGRRRTARPTEAPPVGAASGPGFAARLRTVPVLACVLVVLLALAVFFGVSTLALRNSPATANTALTDIGATTEVANQLGDALEIVYSYDFARLDENERAAREVITTAFSTEFDRLFTQVRELAPQQQAVVSATVTVSAVQEISGDRAVLVAFMDQRATTAANAEQAAAAGRLTVVGERVDGRWRVASVESR